MSTYLPNVPTGTVPLKQDYLNLQNNFSQLDTTYGVDHYKFSDNTANNGYHNTVTTPIISGGVEPNPPADHPQFYGFQDSANIGVLQYSRQSDNGASQHVAPTPVTMLQSQVTALTITKLSTFPNNFINILDFTGLTRAYGKFICANMANPIVDYAEIDFFWNGTTGTQFRIAGDQTRLNIGFNGVLFQVFNSIVANIDLTQFYWTMQFYRTS